VYLAMLITRCVGIGDAHNQMNQIFTCVLLASMQCDVCLNIIGSAIIGVKMNIFVCYAAPKSNRLMKISLI